MVLENKEKEQEAMSMLQVLPIVLGGGILLGFGGLLWRVISDRLKRPLDRRELVEFLKKNTVDSEQSTLRANSVAALTLVADAHQQRSREPWWVPFAFFGAVPIGAAMLVGGLLLVGWLLGFFQ